MGYLGSEGTLVGVDYPIALYVNSGFINEERLKAQETWATDWPAGCFASSHVHTRLAVTS